MKKLCVTIIDGKIDVEFSIFRYLTDEELKQKNIEANQATDGNVTWHSVQIEDLQIAESSGI